MHRKAALGWLTCLTIAVVITVAGCSGGDDGNDVAPPPADGTGTLNGQVVAASDTGVLVPNAVVTVEEIGRSVTTGVSGGFAFSNLPVGTWTVTVTTPQSEDLGTARARVPVARNETTTVSLAVLPLGIVAPAQISLDPTSVTIDVNGRVAYRSQVRGPGSQIYEEIQPTWVVEGGVGHISPQGLFTAQSVGEGRVTAYSGNAARSSSVVVVGPRPPQISSFRVNPQSLPATGGEILISAAVRDGDGINPQDVIAEILPAGGVPEQVPMEVTNPDSAIRCPAVPNCFVDASFGATYQVPANDNRPSPDGIQAPQTYTVSIRVRDRSGVSNRSEFIEFVVRGIDPPPARPGI